MHINFDIDSEYVLNKSCEFYKRKPYIDSNTVYCYVDYCDKNISDFLGNKRSELNIMRKNEQWKWTGYHKIGLGNIIATRIEWRWEYSGPRHYPVGAKTVIDWDLRKGTAEMIDLEKTKGIKTVQPEHIFYSVYSSVEYKKCKDSFNRFWMAKK
jgi:hypothetical protein